MIDGYDRTCQLCRLAEDGEVLTRLHYENERLIVVDCLVCRVPMAVLKAHRKHFDPNEKEAVRLLFRQMLSNLTRVHDEDDSSDYLTEDELRLFRLLPDWYYQGYIQWVIDWEQRQIPDHPHCHLRPFPFPNTSQWEEV